MSGLFPCVVCWSVVVPEDLVEPFTEAGVAMSMILVDLVLYDAVHDEVFRIIGMGSSVLVGGRVFRWFYRLFCLVLFFLRTRVGFRVVLGGCGLCYSIVRSCFGLFWPVEAVPVGCSSVMASVSIFR